MRLPPQGSHPGDADQQARARRWQGSKLARDRPRRATVLARLQHGWSPQPVAGRLAREHHQPGISPETISRFIDAPLARQKDDAWRHSLPQAQTTRGRRGAKGRSPASCITLRRPLAERPDTVAERRPPGHGAADLLVCRLDGHASLTLHERPSRLLMAARPPGNAAAPLAHALGRLRRPLPRKTDLAPRSEEPCTRLIPVYTTTPRNCLGSQTPAEIVTNPLLPFTCESTFLRARE